MSHYGCSRCHLRYDDCTCIVSAMSMHKQPQGSTSGPKVVGYEPKIAKRCTCGHCGAIIEYLPIHERETGNTDEGTRIKGVNCPNCGTFRRTN